MFNRASKILATLAATTALAGTATAQEMPGEGVTVRPVVGLIAEEYFQSRILFQALADLGYEVAEPLETEIQTAHLAVGTGDADFYPIHWGTLHQPSSRSPAARMSSSVSVLSSKAWCRAI
ncbi:L-proline glycine betaine binding ABC transporter protein ProX [Limimaricola cinnabarinus]|uniref:L-proline glycine betaine binding ABC transporter protein ProX n=1 Tax=Limimaricola cinnabarinus LL-001 TaxID=1337093 RepID=U2YP81_9RHOB|nr:L-proline glycine betaine binding ABC transporter protein ProX [Limimaricola cinnabarinus]GAD57186.1 L-proline glycine betaine binding ABC transporter protein ProX [Limimaricola cinnabarinus LL-001]